MSGARRRGSSLRSFGRHASRTLLTLGLILLVAVTIGLAAEITLQATITPSGGPRPTYTSPRAILRLALVSLQAALPVVGALVAAPLLVSRLLHDLHGTETVSQAHSRLNRFLFGALNAEPSVRVSKGQVASRENDVVRQVGGPASLSVYSDSAVVTEQRGELKRVLCTGVHRLDPYERIWETVDRRPQRWVREVFALTKEGIPISCDIDVLFRIGDSTGRGEQERRGRQSDRERSSTCDPDAVLQAATSTSIEKQDDASRRLTWTDQVAFLVESVLRDILATYRLDWLIRAPQAEQDHPRDEIRERLRIELAERADELGTVILDIDLGQIRVKIESAQASGAAEIDHALSDLVSDQWIEAWHANWRARALTSRAEGEAELLRIDSARIEAQVEMIIGLAEVLQPVVGSNAASEAYILALRLVEALRWMSYDPSTRDYMPPEAMRTLSRLQQMLDADSVDARAPGLPGQGEERP